MISFFKSHAEITFLTLTDHTQIQIQISKNRSRMYLSCGHVQCHFEAALSDTSILHSLTTVPRDTDRLPTFTAILLTQRFSHAERGEKKGKVVCLFWFPKKLCIPQTLNTDRIAVSARLAAFHSKLYFSLLMVQAAGLQEGT